MSNQREIKLRVWDTETKEMHGPFDILTVAQDGVILQTPIDYEQKAEVLQAARSTQILMQFTGLRDSKGKEIWESDVVKVTQNDDDGFYAGCVFKIELDGGTWKAGPLNAYNWAKNGDLEVVGNVHEHPNFLTKEKS